MIVPMKRLTLIALKVEEERIMQALQSISAVQIISTKDGITDADALQQAEANVQRFSGALRILKPYAKAPSFLDAKPETTVDELEANMGTAYAVSADLETAERRRAAIRAQIDKHLAQIQTLTPWQAMQTPLNLVAPTRETALFVGRLKAEHVARLAEIKDRCAAQVFEGDKEIAAMVICHKDAEEEVSAFIKGLEWTDVSFPKTSQTAAELIAADKQAIEALKQELDEIEQSLQALGVNRALIASATDAAVIDRDRALAKNLVENTKTAFVLEGWVRSDETDKLLSAITDVTDAFYLDVREPAEDEEPPIIVKNSKFATPYEAVTNLYSRPAPGSIDGTPLMAPWYFLLFGMMLSDTGYGIVLALGCWFFQKRAKLRGMMGGITRVLMMGGISTIVWGVLVGTFFGMDWNPFFISIGSWFNQDWTSIFMPNGPEVAGLFPLIVDPGKDPIIMLGLCFGLGLIHILAGVFIKIYMAFRDGDWQTALYDNISWLLVIFGLLMYVGATMLMTDAAALATASLVMVVLGASMVLFMKGRGNKNIAKRLVSGAGGLYDITGYLSDVLSYARLFALGISTGVIGSVFNTLVGMIMGASSFWLVKLVLVLVGVALLVFLHTFNMGINTLGTFIHCARLQYVEFYGKFYEVGGKEFKPLGYKTRHVRVLEK